MVPEKSSVRDLQNTNSQLIFMMGRGPVKLPEGSNLVSALTAGI